jgi:hypothetical protein
MGTLRGQRRPMIRGSDNGRDADGFRTDVVAIVTGGSSGTGRQVARALASWGWAIVIVYLEHQLATEVTVAEILAAEGKAIAVRADLSDELDVQRLFAESTSAFERVDIVVHTTPGPASLLYRHAARHVGPRGAIVSIPDADRVPIGVARQLLERGVSVANAPAQGVLSFFDRWRQETVG